MPLVADEFIPPRPRYSSSPVAPTETPGIAETIGSAFTVANWPYRIWREHVGQNGADYDPSHDPMALIRGTKYEADPVRFARSYSESETRSIMRRWDEDESARHVLSRAGWPGVVSTVGAGLVDPTIFFPVAKVFSGVKAGHTALRMAGDVALSGVLSASVAEGALMTTTPELTPADFARTVGTATILSGLLGGGVGVLVSRAERKAIAETLDADRLAWGADIAATPSPAGAAVADARRLELDTPPLLSRLADPTAKVSPPRRVLNSPFLTARRAVVDLVETPYIFKENAQGAATMQGPALDRLARMEKDKARVAVMRQFDDAFARYRFGAPGGTLAERAGQRLARLADHVRPTEKATFQQFRSMVDEALRNSDSHAIPEVAETARFIRSRVIIPWRDRAIAAGLLPEGVDVKTADSYMLRMWNKEKLIGERPNARRIFAEWLTGEEAKKAAIREDLKRQVDLKSLYDETIAALESRVAGREATLGALVTRADEMSRMNAFAFHRAETLREALTETSSKRLKARAGEGALFEGRARGRGAALNDQAAGKRAALDDLARRIETLKSERDRLRGEIEANIGRWEGRSALEAQKALRERAKRDAARAEKADELGQRFVQFNADGNVTGLTASLPDAITALTKTASRKVVRDDAGNIIGDVQQVARSTSADFAVDKAISRILSKARLSDRREIEALSDEIIDRIVGSPDGRLTYDLGSVRDARTFPDSNPDPRGPLAARSFSIPDSLVRDFFDTDALAATEIFLNAMVPDVLLTERFGDVFMTDTMRRLHGEAASMMHAAKTPRERARVKALADSVESDLAAMRDRVRHTYGVSSDPRMRFMGRMAATAARYDTMTNLGGAALASLPDLAGIQWRHGFNGAFRHAWRPFVKALYSPETRKALSAWRSQLRTLGIAAETWLNTRTSAISDVTDAYRPGSRVERGVKAAADRFGLASLLTPWTDFGKFAAGMVAGGEYARAVAASVAGKATKRQVRDLAEAGIDAAMAQRIHLQMTAAGGADVIDGITIPNAGAWQDRGAREAFEGALARDVDLMILTPGAEKPLAMSKPVAALVLQYKSFVAAANERLLVRGLQARDAQALSGLVSAVGLGVLVEFLYLAIVGRDPPDNPADMIKAGVARAGVLGWYSEANAISSKLTGGAADAFRLIGTTRPDARYISRSKLGALLGPSANKFESVLEIGSDLANLKWTPADTHRVRRLLIGQNLFYVRGLLDKVEGQ